MKQKKKKAAKKVEPSKKSDEEKIANTSKEKVFDITSPGKSMPSASARPVIVTHKPNVSDPMVSPTSPKTKEAKEDTETPSTGEGAEMVLSAPKKNRIEPLHTDVMPDEDKQEIPEEKADEIVEKEDQADQASQPLEEKPVPDTAEPSDEISEVAHEVTTKKEVQSEAAKKESEAAKRQAEIEALVNNKQFFVPINAVKKRRSMKLVIFLLVITLLVVGFLIAWDAELFDLGTKPPTDFF